MGKDLKNKILKILYHSPIEKNINLILRYGPIVKELKRIKRNSKSDKVKILEIGSGTIGITRFYKGVIVGIDIEQERYSNPRLKYLNASATNLPFKDKSFDVVISVDTLEHLSRKQQLKMVNEAYRVSRKYILLTYPIGFNKYHKLLIKRYRKTELGEALSEHIYGGTPNGNEIKKALKNKKYKLRVRKGTHPRLAYYLNCLEQNIITKLLSRTILKIFIPIFKQINGDVRKYFFIEKINL